MTSPSCDYSCNKVLGSKDQIYIEEAKITNYYQFQEEEVSHPQRAYTLGSCVGIETLFGKQ